MYKCGSKYIEIITETGLTGWAPLSDATAELAGGIGPGQTAETES